MDLVIRILTLLMHLVAGFLRLFIRLCWGITILFLLLAVLVGCDKR